MEESSFSKLERIRELLVITPLEWIPALILGRILRRIFYRLIFKRIGRRVNIQQNVNALGTSNIELGSETIISRGVRLDARGSNNQLCLKDGACLESGVIIVSLRGTTIEIGEGSYIGCYSCISGPGNVKIGKKCLIAAHSGIYANNHIFADPTLTIQEQGVTREGITIGDDCWLGDGVKVLDGVTIGEGCVIGAGAVVTKDIPPYSIAVGLPAQVIGSRKSSDPKTLPLPNLKKGSISAQNIKETEIPVSALRLERDM